MALSESIAGSGPLSGGSESVGSAVSAAAVGAAFSSWARAESLSRSQATCVHANVDRRTKMRDALPTKLFPHPYFLTRNSSRQRPVLRLLRLPRLPLRRMH